MLADWFTPFASIFVSTGGAEAYELLFYLEFNQRLGG